MSGLIPRQEEKPAAGGRKLTMFVRGDDAEANQAVAGPADDLGFEAPVTGPCCHPRYFEPMAMLWVNMAYAQGKGTGFGFCLRRR